MVSWLVPRQEGAAIGDEAMTIGNIILGAIAFGSIIVIAASAIEARKAQEDCDRYLREIRERSRQ